MNDRITAQQFHESEGVGDWRVIGDGACTFVATHTFGESVRLVEAIGEIAGIDSHPPDIDIRSDGVTVHLLTVDDDYYGMSMKDVEHARQISVVARSLGLAPDPATVQSFVIIPGAKDVAEIMPFWGAVLGYEPRPDSPEEDLVDPRNRWPGFWFESMDQLRGDGGGAIHVAVWVPPEQAENRVAAALAAGGRMVRDDFAPAWWTLADAAGNEADIATVLHRE